MVFLNKGWGGVFISYKEAPHRKGRKGIDCKHLFLLGMLRDHPLKRLDKPQVPGHHSEVPGLLSAQAASMGAQHCWAAGRCTEID